MAVQAQYPSNILLLNRKVQEDRNISGGGYLDQSHLLINDNEVRVDNNNNNNNNQRKRRREVGTRPSMNINTYGGYTVQNQNQSNELIDISQLHNQQQQSNVVCTGLGLSFGDQNQQHHQVLQPHSSLLSFLSQDFALTFKQQSDELNCFLHAQGEQLRRTLAEKRQKHYRALLNAAEEALIKRLKEKETEVENAAFRTAELEARWAQLSAEAQSWRDQAQAQEAQAAKLKAQINHAISTNGAQQQGGEKTGLTCIGGGDVEDSESAYVDPVSERRVNSTPSCRMCRTRGACVVILPCRHLCVCTGCDQVVRACPVCLAFKSASLEVHLS